MGRTKIGGETMKVSVIIPTAGYSLDSLRALLNVTKNYETIVVADDKYSLIREVVKDFKGVVCVRNKDKPGFSGAINTGIRVSKGDIIFLVNDDVYITERTVPLFLKVFEIVPKCIVGPVTNRGLDVQTLVNVELTKNNLDVYESDQVSLVRVMAVSGFFMVFPRIVYEEVGWFDSFGPGGFEDVDFCYRAFLKNIPCYVARNIPVFHGPGLTVRDRVHAYTDVARSFFNKWRDETPKRLVALYRVKNQVSDLMRSIKKSKEVCDDVIVLDDHSTEDVESYVKSMGCVYVKAECSNEVDQRNQLLYEARKVGADWVISIDADEVLEDRFTKDVVHQLMRPFNPLVQGYMMKVRTFWRGNESFRCDSVWKTLGGVRMFRLTPDVKWVSCHPQGLHCVVDLPLGSMRHCRLSFKHYGYDTVEKFMSKYEYYRQMDQYKDVRLIGTEDYSHLIDESNLRLRPWIENNTHSLVVNVRDQVLQLVGLIDRYYYCFDEIVLGIDSRSKFVDSLTEFANLLGCKHVIVDVGDDYAAMRNECLKECSCKWITVLDLDEVFENDNVFLDGIYTRSDAILYEVFNFLPSGKVSITNNARTFRNDGSIKFTGLCHETIEDSIVGRPLDRGETRIFHFGFLSEDLDAKLEKYERLSRLAIEKNPNDPRPYFNLALHYIEIDDDDTAQELLTKCLKLNPDFTNAWVSLASIYARKAMNILGRLISQGRSNPQIEEQYSVLKQHFSAVKVSKHGRRIRKNT